MEHSTETAYLIVNADDYGYFPCVSRGILDAVAVGMVSATGVLANAGSLGEQLSWLNSYPQLDLGVHLNLTYGEPLSEAMRHVARRRWGGRLPTKEIIVGALVTGIVTHAEVRDEWRTQIDRCLAYGLKLRFLNSHEHVHMLPSLLRIAQDLARQYEIEHVRYPVAESPRKWTTGAILRNVVIGSLGWLARHRVNGHSISCLGLGESGRLSLGYINDLAERLERGRVYELMCHPGFDDPAEITDIRLRSYHRWEQERKLLTSDEARRIMDAKGIRIIGYRDLSIL